MANATRVSYWRYFTHFGPFGRRRIGIVQNAAVVLLMLVLSALKTQIFGPPSDLIDRFLLPGIIAAVVFAIGDPLVRYINQDPFDPLE